MADSTVRCLESGSQPFPCPSCTPLIRSPVSSCTAAEVDHVHLQSSLLRISMCWFCNLSPSHSENLSGGNPPASHLPRPGHLFLPSLWSLPCPLPTVTGDHAFQTFPACHLQSSVPGIRVQFTDFKPIETLSLPARSDTSKCSEMSISRPGSRLPRYLILSLLKLTEYRSHKF